MRVMAFLRVLIYCLVGSITIYSFVSRALR